MISSENTDKQFEADEFLDWLVSQEDKGTPFHVFDSEKWLWNMAQQRTQRRGVIVHNGVDIEIFRGRCGPISFGLWLKSHI